MSVSADGAFSFRGPGPPSGAHPSLPVCEQNVTASARSFRGPYRPIPSRATRCFPRANRPAIQSAASAVPVDAERNLAFRPAALFRRRRSNPSFPPLRPPVPPPPPPFSPLFRRRFRPLFRRRRFRPLFRRRRFLRFRLAAVSPPRVRGPWRTPKGVCCGAGSRTGRRRPTSARWGRSRARRRPFSSRWPECGGGAAAAAAATASVSCGRVQTSVRTSCLVSLLPRCAVVRRGRRHVAVPLSGEGLARPAAGSNPPPLLPHHRPRPDPISPKKMHGRAPHDGYRLLGHAIGAARVLFRIAHSH